MCTLEEEEQSPPCAAMMVDMSNLLDLVKLQIDNIVMDIKSLGPAEQDTALNYLYGKLNGNLISKSGKRASDPGVNEENPKKLKVEHNIENDQVVTVEENAGQGTISDQENQYLHLETSPDSVQDPLLDPRLPLPDCSPPAAAASQPGFTGNIPICKDCGKMFPSLGTLTEHARKMHEGENISYESLEEERMTNFEARYEALNADAGQPFVETTRTFVANESGSAQHNENNVSNSMKLELEFDSSGKFLCPYSECGKSFTTRWSVGEHLGAHTGEWTCKDCGQILACKRSFWRHMLNIHGKEKSEQQTNNGEILMTLGSLGRQPEQDMREEELDPEPLDKGLDFTSITEEELQIPGTENTSLSFLPDQQDENFPTSQQGEIIVQQRDQMHFQQMAENNHDQHLEEQLTDPQLPVQQLQNVSVHHPQHLPNQQADRSQEESGEFEQQESEFPAMDLPSLPSNDGFANYMNPFLNNIEFTFGNTDPQNEQQGIFACEVCNVKLSSSRSLARHSKGQEHQKRLNGELLEANPDDNEKVQPDTDGKFSCDRCEQKLTNRWSLRRHIGKKHANECQVCDVNLSSPQSLDRHSKSQEHLKKINGEPTKPVTDAKVDPDGKFPCSECEKKFNHRWSLKQHMAFHSGDSTCKVCQTSFANVESLKRHEKSIEHQKSAAEPKVQADVDGRFPCNECEKIFSYRENLRLHIETHTGELESICDECGLTLSNQQSLNRHMENKHSKIWKCEECEAVLCRKQDLMLHVRNIHGQSKTSMENEVWSPIKHQTIEYVIDLIICNVLKQSQINDEKKMQAQQVLARLPPGINVIHIGQKKVNNADASVNASSVTLKDPLAELQISSVISLAREAEKPKDMQQVLASLPPSLNVTQVSQQHGIELVLLD